ncbi:cytochrome b [Xanthobacter sp. DSM 24535]|uniref:cytochrome b n=1 Tax=Roseixanthobacter psychrophilus TaxID=3119917 RepID=UPI003728C28A
MTAPASQRWSLPMRGLHWGMAALLVVLLGLGLAMAYGTFDLGQTFALYQWHKSLGVLVMPLVTLRLMLRLGGRHPGPSTHQARARWAPLEAGLARIVHGLFYLLMVALPLTGWLVVSSSPLHLPTRPFNLFTLPDLVAPDANVYASASQLHAILAYLMIGALTLHILGGLKHRFVDRDSTLSRMGM